MNFTKRSFVFAEEQYFSIDDILATEERLPCRFDQGVKKLGFLDPSSGTADLAQGTKLEIPLWMAQALQSRRIISIDLPKVYKEGYRKILNADATIVDLHKMGPYFYHFGLYLLKFIHQDSEEIGKMLSETFRNRFRMLMDTSQNALEEDAATLTANLDRTEVALFNVGHKSLLDLKNWMHRKNQKILTADLVVNHKKRKRTIMEES
ncbi:DNA replication complex GINS protein PSF3 [Parasteatoda tepidariorum]|uniref:DNA replication complex GINS protein PSF3 n=1 Tax=Parasteatoda tepidariorum TaxID=114398 RepID=UPI001C719557|nr:DNA replication complex GINS protein PSF3 [Parasteatoda tepidariorum]XP_015918450.2 DNA replication complex GINS protein PSF3 [Parasteatoda tepidariorum]XP_015918451.2 DNA replication complex GINS protein PSF3 [Parasteatoda tepidariorum]